MKRRLVPNGLSRKRRAVFTCIILLSAFLMITNRAGCQLIFSKNEFAERRQKLMDQIPDGILIIRGTTMPPGSVQFYQNNDLIYFAGVEIPDVILLIDGVERESFLFMTVEEEFARSEGFDINLVKDPAGVSGIENIFPVGEFATVLGKKLAEIKIVYAPFAPEELMAEVSREKRNMLRRTMTEDEWDGRVSRNMQFIHKLIDRFPGVVMKDCSPIIWDLRKIKSSAEIEIMREAARIGVAAHKALMKASGNNVPERELANIFEFTCKMEGANGLAYSTIIMSDLNHAYGHYHKYDRILRDGDFIIIDGGPDYKYYDSDISTTFPANGKFSKTQRESYELALLVRNVCIGNYKPGITLADVGQKVKEALKKNGYDPENSSYKRWYTYGGYNHSVGMAVHDGMGTFKGTNEILQPGFVFACDIMTKADSVTSVRIEDTVVITENGCEVLSVGLPRTVEEIESFMKK